jgi:hypothetical protein
MNSKNSRKIPKNVITYIKAIKIIKTIFYLIKSNYAI